MSTQLLLRIGGIAFLVIALLFAILAIHYFLTNDIRGVMDDLSGKTRAKGVAGANRGRAADARRGAQQFRKAGSSSKAPTVTKGTVAEAAPSQAPEPEISEPQEAEPQFPAPAVDEEDDMGTVVVDIDPDMWAQTPDKQTDVPAEMPQDAAGTVTFQVTRSIVLFESNQIIAANEGM